MVVSPKWPGRSCGSGACRLGGPIAHLGYLRAEFVEKRRWPDDAHYGDLVALCQFLPGPASSQVVFALGMQRAGLLGAFGLVEHWKVPPWLVVVAVAAAGQWLLPR